MSTEALRSAKGNTFKTNLFVKDVNKLLLNFIRNNKPAGYVPLGPGFKTLDYSIAKDFLQYYRMVSKFEEPDAKLANLRRTDTLSAMIDYDSSGITGFNPGKMDLEPFIRLQLYQARKLFNEIISDYHFSYTDVQFSTGETYCSARGDTSVYAKLSNLQHWTVTPECFDLAARLVYNVPGLKASARQHFKRFRFAHKKMWNQFVGPMRKKDIAKWKFIVFKLKLKHIMTFVGGARVTTVPKNNSTDRAIECECMFNMLCQRVIAAYIRKKIAAVFMGHYAVQNRTMSLKHSQLLHQKLIADLTNATIDLKNASNSVWLAVVRWFSGDNLFMRHLEETRSGHVELPDGSWHYLNMLSPMGNGFTFEVMTLLLFCCTRVFDTCSMVYGDDIIVHVDVAHDVIRLLEVIGFKTNETKTFLDGNFRESCGGFTCKGEPITSFECHWCENVTDATILVNKIGLMARTRPSQFTDKLLVLHDDLLRLIKDSSLLRPYERELEDRISHKGYVSPSDVSTFVTDLADGIFVPKTKFDRIRKSDKVSRELFKELIVDYADQVLDIHKDPKDLLIYYKYEIEAISYVDSNGDKLLPLDDVNIFWTYYYLSAGRCETPSYRKSRVVKRKVISVY